MTGGEQPEFTPLRRILPDAVVARFAHVGAIAGIEIYRSLDTGREIAVDPAGRTHDLYAGGYWPVPRGDAVRYALGETDTRPGPAARE